MSRHGILARSPARRSRESGSVLVVAMIALIALATLGSLTVVTVRSSLSGTTHDQFKAVALSAAEAGIAVGIDYARRNLQPGLLWSNLVTPNNNPPCVPGEPPCTGSPPLNPVPGNGIKPGQSGNIFSADAHAWYQVEFLNNIDDGPAEPMGIGFIHTGFRDGIDTDGRITIRAIGHGPNNASVRLEVEIQTPTVFGDACPAGHGNNDGQGCGLVQDPDPSVVPPPAPTPF